MINGIAKTGVGGSNVGLNRWEIITDVCSFHSILPFFHPLGRNPSTVQSGNSSSPFLFRMAFLLTTSEGWYSANGKILAASMPFLLGARREGEASLPLLLPHMLSCFCHVI